MVPEEKLESQIQKQMGCMAGFFHIFDRHHIVSGKRLYSSSKPLPPSLGTIDSATESENLSLTPALSKELSKSTTNVVTRSAMPPPSPSPLPEPRSSAPDSHSKQLPPPLPLPLPIFELKEGTKSTWKLCKEAPRLSLDSRATFDPAKGGLKARCVRTSNTNTNTNASAEDSETESEMQRKSTSVIARLMGLESLPDSDLEPVTNPQLRRSASESRADRDMFRYRYIDGVNFQLKPPQQQQQQQQKQNFMHNGNATRNVVIRNETAATNGRAVDRREWNAARNIRPEPKGANGSGGYRGMGQRKSFFDSADFFPEPKKTASMIFNEIERRLKMRGIDEPSKDLETLKQILDALQFKGLLHSNNRPESPTMRNGKYNQNLVCNESPIVITRPSRPPFRTGRVGTDSPARTRSAHREYSPSPAVSPRPADNRSQIRGRGTSSPTRSEGGIRSPNRQRPLSNETQQRVSPVQSPRVVSRQTVAEQINGCSAIRNMKSRIDSVPAEDELSSVSGSSISNSTDTERPSIKVEECRGGKNLLERCDKLIHSIAEMTAAPTKLSPVSVLDSSFYKEESSPSPMSKRHCFQSKDQLVDSEDDLWNFPISPIRLKMEETSDDCDFNYVSDILTLSNYLPEESDLFLLLEKQQYLKGKDSSEVSKIERKLIFDTINEILNWKRQLPPWKVVLNSTKPGIGRHTSLLQQVWSEFQGIREREVSDDLFDVVCGVLKKDLASDAMNGWGDCPIELSEAVLDIERLIFKDLISETIRDLAAFSDNGNRISSYCRKLVF